MGPSDTRESIIKRRGYRKDIRGDKFSLYISSYPVAVDYLKGRIGDSKKVLAELCCGIGVTLEYLGDSFGQIIGVEIDKKILSGCADNLKSAGLSDKSMLILGDINSDEVLKKIKADIVIYDIPFCSPKFDYQLIKDELGSCEFQKVFINGKHDRNHIYLGKLKQKDGITGIKLLTR